MMLGPMWLYRTAVAIALLLSAPKGGLSAEAQPGVPLFSAPAFVMQADAVARAIATGAIDDAAAALEALRALAPRSPVPDLLQALAAAAADNREGAITALERAAARGLPDMAAILGLPQLAPLADDPRIAALRAAPPPPAAAARPPAATVVTGADAMVSVDNTVWDPALERLVARFDFPERPPRPRLLDVRPDDTPEGRLLARLVARGEAAGNWGDLYDNRDRGHSRLRVERFPLLTPVSYAEGAVAAGVEYGLNTQMLFDRITLGNSSTAYTVRRFWRSLPRIAMTRDGGAARLYDLYRRNHLYLYPEHRDHDPERGDVYPANTPFVIASQGSSGSDRPHLRAVALILAALRPDTKRFLEDTGLVAPTVQMIYRRHRRGIETTEDYLSGRAHPSAFDREALDYQRLVRAANALLPDTVPPMVRLSVVDEAPVGPAPPLPGGRQNEVLFDTPGAIARIAYGLARDRRYVLSVEDTVDPNGLPQRFHWRVLRGAGVRVTPLDDAGLRAAIIVPWQTAQPVPGAPDLLSSRVDIGVFADNGHHLSAPAFFTVYASPGQARTYAPDGRLLSVDYRRKVPADAYVDPWLFPARLWRDVFDYGDDGRLLGWRREQRGAAARFYDAAGVPLSGPRGRRLADAPASYDLGPRRDRDGRRTVIERSR